MRYKYHKNDYFIDYIFDLNAPNPKEVFKIQNSKIQNIPSELYHYYGLNQDNVNSLINSYVYANHPYSFNDPFDCNKDLISFENASLEDVLELNNNVFPPESLTELYKSNKIEDKLKLNDHLNWLLFNVIYMKLGIFCMTDNFESMEMWTYYSNHHGFAIKLDLSLFKFAFWGPFPINYTDSFEKIDYSILKTGSLIYQSNVKAKCWDQEKEWRLLIYGPNVMKVPFRDLPKSHNRKFYYNPKAVKEIILGYNFFELNEFIIESSSIEKQVIKLRNRIKDKRSILKFILKNNINTSIISIKRDSTSTLGARPIEITKICTNKYEIKYVG